MSDPTFTQRVTAECLEAQEAANLIICSFPSSGVSSIPETNRKIIKEAAERMITRFGEIKADLLQDQTHLVSVIDSTVGKLNNALTHLNGDFLSPSNLGVIIGINF